MWFSIDKQGLASILERRGKAFAIYELIQNAWDSGATIVRVNLDPLPSSPYAQLNVVDNGEGFDDLDHAHTLFARSRRAADPQKRGRFNLGEKLVLACCRHACIVTTIGTITFTESGERKKSLGTTKQGTSFSAEIRMTREEYHEVIDSLRRLIPPVETIINNKPLERRASLVSFEVKLPTEIADADGMLRRTVRSTTVEVYEAQEDKGMLCEMGVPIVETDCPYDINVMQKVPMNLDRDNVQPAFMRAVNVAVLNHVHEHLDESQASSPWVQEAVGDSRAVPEAVKDVIVKRFGDRAVVASPGDPIANANCAAAGYTVIPGGSMSSQAWANVRKHEVLLPSSKVFPTPKPEEQAAKSGGGQCPLCGK